MKKLLVLALSSLLAGCAGMRVDDFAAGKPAFRPEEYFIGRTYAYGLFEDRFGKVRREFTVIVDGRMDGDTLVMDEDFTYTDGAKEQRHWRLARGADGVYEGTAKGVVGMARGRAAGNAFNWKYTFDLDVGDGKIWRVKFDDWMFLQQDRMLINRAWVTRWGFDIGSVTLSFRKDAPAEPTPGPADR